jgi:hypothetical protein
MIIEDQICKYPGNLQFLKRIPINNLSALLAKRFYILLVRLKEKRENLWVEN